MILGSIRLIGPSTFELIVGCPWRRRDELQGKIIAVERLFCESHVLLIYSMDVVTSSCFEG